MEKITLYDENDNPLEYELIDLFEFNDNVYGAFAPLMTDENADDEEVEVVMLKVLEKDDTEYFSEIEDENDFLPDLLGEISRVKNERIDVRDYHASSCEKDSFQKIYEYYENRLKTSGLLR